jgi:hypothetical protein
VRGQTDRTIAAEQAVLNKAYADGGRRGLAAAIAQRIAAYADAGRFYLLTDGALAPLAGNLAAWPDGLADTQGSPSRTPPPLRASTNLPLDYFFAALRCEGKSARPVLLSIG